MILTAPDPGAVFTGVPAGHTFYRFDYGFLSQTCSDRKPDPKGEGGHIRPTCRLLCGRPQNSRQVGRALKLGLAGSAFPAHRVVNSQGFLSGAAAFETPDMQRLLLEAEGIAVRDNRVDLRLYGWKNTIEEALSLQKSFEERGI